MVPGGAMTLRGGDWTVSAVGGGADEGASSVVESGCRAMSFMDIRLPRGWLGVVSPWAAFRLLHQAQADPSWVPRACYATPRRRAQGSRE